MAEKRLSISLSGFAKRDFRLYPWSVNDYRERDLSEVFTFYVVKSKQSPHGVAYVEKSKKGLLVRSFDMDTDMGNCRMYLIFNNDGSRLLREFGTYCGYDRGPRIAALFLDLMA